eukprot:scaffold896_cov250-Pinguiococcus_pyrenoidosus.AAC.4
MLGRSIPNQAFSCSWAESEHARYTSAFAVARTSPSAAMVAALILDTMAACFGVLRDGKGEGEGVWGCHRIEEAAPPQTGVLEECIS